MLRLLLFASLWGESRNIVASGLTGVAVLTDNFHRKYDSSGRARSMQKASPWDGILVVGGRKVIPCFSCNWSRVRCILSTGYSCTRSRRSINDELSLVNVRLWISGVSGALFGRNSFHERYTQIKYLRNRFAVQCYLRFSSFIHSFNTDATRIKSWLWN